MKYDCYKRFLESDDFHECVENELGGKELPEVKESKQHGNLFSWKNFRPRLSLTVSTKKKKAPNQTTRFYDLDKNLATAQINTPLKAAPPKSARINTDSYQRLKYLSQSEVNVARNSFCSTPNMSPSSNFRNEMLLKRLLLNGRSMDFSDDKNSDAFFSDLMCGSQCAPPLSNQKNFFPYLSQPAVNTLSDKSTNENESYSANSGCHSKIDSKKPKQPSLLRFNISPVANRIALRMSDAANVNKLPLIPERKIPSRIPIKKAMAPPPVPPKFKHPFPPPPPRQNRPRVVRQLAANGRTANNNDKVRSVYV